MKVINIFLILIFVSNSTFAISPLYHLTTKGAVYDFIIENDLIYVATDVGVVEVFNYKTKKKLSEIKIPLIKDFVGEQILPKIFSIDKIKGKEGIILTVQGDKGYRDIYYYKNKKLI